MKKIGIFGGTFDPLHRGHLFLADLAGRGFGLDEVVFLPLNRPSYKHLPQAPPEVRLRLLQKALANQQNYRVSDLELQRGGVTYTVDTLRELHQREQADYYFIIGSDTLPELPRWKQTAEIFGLCTFICIQRPGAEQDVERCIRALEHEYGAKILTLSNKGKDISSSQVRERLNRGEDVGELVPEEIAADIRRYYQSQEKKTVQREQMLERLQAILDDEERFEHSLSVEKTAIELAKLHGVQQDKAALAGLLHDCAKNVKNDPAGFGAKHGIQQHLPRYAQLPLPVLHAHMGTHLAQKEFGICDPEILSAIASHTSGKVGMSELDKVIYLADYIEPARGNAPQLQEVRRLARENLDEAMLKAMEYSIGYIRSKGSEVHASTLEAYDDLAKKMGRKPI